MKILRDENGQTFVLTALCMSVLLGFMGLALDVALAYHAKRNLQTAADDAAIAAALNYQYVVSGDPTTAAQTAAAKNGISSSYVTVNSNPTTGYHQGIGFFEVVVAKPQATFFAKVLGYPSFTVAARAVAGVTPASSCMYITNPRDADTFKIKGNATVTATNCGIQVNSTSGSAFCDGGSASIAATYVRLAGGQDTGGGCNKAPGSTVFSGYASSNDPFINKPWPPSSACSSANGDLVTVSGSTAITSSTTLPSKSYTAGDGTTYQLTCFNNTSSGGSPVVLDGSTTPLTLGTAGQGQIFLFENGVTINGQVTVNGTIDNYQGSFSNQNGNLTITAPASKSLTYNGLALVQPSTNTTGGCQDGSLNNYVNGFSPHPPCLQVQFGSANEDLNGYIYAPTAVTYLQDQGGGVTAAGVVSYDMYINSKLTIDNSYNDAHPATTPLSKVTLVE
ncbi:MAG TPA: pilus assembly protein TadG-related protein [Terracidiphilus sp.]|jgi:Flp pilus assembly protein TadG